MIKQIAEWKEVDGKIYRLKLEHFLSSVMAGFPYKHSVVYKALVESMKHLEFGKTPTVFKLICGTLFGQRYAQSAFCSFCGQANAVKCCSICKVIFYKERVLNKEILGGVLLNGMSETGLVKSQKSLQFTEVKSPTKCIFNACSE